MKFLRCISLLICCVLGIVSVRLWHLQGVETALLEVNQKVEVLEQKVKRMEQENWEIELENQQIDEENQQIEKENKEVDKNRGWSGF